MRTPLLHFSRADARLRKVRRRLGKRFLGTNTCE